MEATRRIVGDWPGPGPAPRVVVLTTFDLDEYVHAALRAGADGFLLKNSRPDDLVRALHAAVGGEPVLAPSVTRRLIDTLTALPTALLPGTPGASPAPERVIRHRFRIHAPLSPRRAERRLRRVRCEAYDRPRRSAFSISDPNTGASAIEEPYPNKGMGVPWRQDDPVLGDSCRNHCRSYGCATASRDKPSARRVCEAVCAYGQDGPGCSGTLASPWYAVAAQASR
ncbi:response regulator transcription factor [Streptomyces sp. NPDC050549]|uniref:response regulator n=1 Tax=Streptomyces sp. NPDC050549 TaxID=3155406 RepID=UPI003418F1B7